MLPLRLLLIQLKIARTLITPCKALHAFIQFKYTDVNSFPGQADTSLYTPTVPLGRRISNQGMPTTNIARLYHSFDRGFEEREAGYKKNGATFTDS